MTPESPEDRLALLLDFGEEVRATSPDGAVSVFTAIFDREHAAIEVDGGEHGAAVASTLPAITARASDLPADLHNRGGWRIEAGREVSGVWENRPDGTGFAVVALHKPEAIS